MFWWNELGQALAPVVGRLDGVIVARMVLTLVLCGLIGLERSTHDRASGFRPHILVGLGACLMALAGGYGFADLAGARDPMRIASYVVSGVGFLGAGAILRHGATVRGLATAATLWGAAGIGVAVAVGLGGLATLGTVLLLVTLRPLERLEARIRLGASQNALTIQLSDDHRAVGRTLAALNRLGVALRRTVLLPGSGSSAILQVDLQRPLTREQSALLVKRLLTLKGVEQIETTARPQEGEDASSAQEGSGPHVWGALADSHPQDEGWLKDLDEPEAEESSSAPSEETKP